MPFDLSSLTPQAQAAAIYIGYYDRAPDPFGSAFWERAVDNPALSLSDIATDFASQQETLAVHPFFSDPSPEEAAAFVAELYLNLFNRAPDIAGLEFWSGVLENAIAGIGNITVGEIIMQIIAGAQDTAETKDLTTITNKIAVAVAWTNAAAEGGLTEASSYGDNAASQASAKSIIEGVTDETETLETATSTIRMFEVSLKAGVAADALTAAEEAQADADAAEAAATDAEGAQAYVLAAAALKTAADQALADALASEEIAKEAKLAAAVTDATEDDAAAAAAFEVAQDAIAAAEAAIEAAEAEVESAAESVIAAQPGDNFTFTIQDDVLTGTTGVDVFRAPLYVTPEAKSVNTLGGFDAVDGDLGIDTLYAAIIGNVGEPELISIENLYIQGRGALAQANGGSGPTATIDLNNADSVQQLWNDRSISNLTVENVQNSVIVGMNDVDKDTTFTVNYVADAFGDEDAVQQLVLNGVGTKTAFSTLDFDFTGTTPLPSITELSITASGTNNLKLTDAAQAGTSPNFTDDALAIDTIDITGTGTLMLASETANFDVLESLNAADFSGDLTIDVSGSIDLESATLGSGDDSLTVSGAVVTGANSDTNKDTNSFGNDELLDPSNDTILDGGDGTDSLTITSFSTDLDFTNVSNFEELVIDDDNDLKGGSLTFGTGKYTDLNLSTTDFTSLIVNDAITLAGDFTVTGASGFNEIVLNGLVTGTAGDFILEGFETVEITVNADAESDLIAEDLVSATFNLGKGAIVSVPYLLADDLETLDVNLGSNGQLTGPTTGSAKSLETLTVDGGKDSSVTYFFARQEVSLAEIDLSDMNGTTVIGYSQVDTGELPNSVEVMIGAGDLWYGYLAANAEDTAELVDREVFKFVGDDIGDVYISSFETSIGRNGDRLDFSMFDGVNSIDDLDIVYTGDETTVGNTVIRADGEFSGLITIIGTDLSSDDFNFIF